MSGFDRLGRELESAAEQRRATSWARRTRSAGGAAVIAGGVATVVVIAVVAVVLLHGHAASNPTESSTLAGAPAQPSPAAPAAAWARLLRCPGPGQGNKPSERTTISDAAPDPQLVAALGVLQGPWTAADAPPAGVSCKSVSPLFPAQRLYVRYARYVGPGLRGGEVFLVPGEFTIKLPRRLKVKSPLRNGSQLAMACLITVGAPPQTLGAFVACPFLSQINRPTSEAFAIPQPAPIPRSVLRRLCAHVPDSAARAKCLAGPRVVHFAPIHQVISGVVRDGIVSLDVYTRVKGVRKLVLDISVNNNVYSFQIGGTLSGLLTLVFKNASSQTVQTTPTETGTVNTSNSVVGTGTSYTGTVEGKAVTTPAPAAVAPLQTVTGLNGPVP